jgi:transcriptional regulator with PAS, ATPase and Fis domain
LRVFHEREVGRLGGETPRKIDIRLVTATNANLAENVKQGCFRENLYYRFNVI